jgi:alkylhydroperoxidase family enzyme
VEGGAADLVQALKTGNWQSAAGLNEREQGLCALAEKLSGTPTRMAESDWEALREQGLSDEGRLEVAHIVGIFNYLTRLADGLGLQLDAATLAASSTGKGLRRPLS